MLQGSSEALFYFKTSKYLIIIYSPKYELTNLHTCKYYPKPKYTPFCWILWSLGYEILNAVVKKAGLAAQASFCGPIKMKTRCVGGIPYLEGQGT